MSSGVPSKSGDRDYSVIEAAVMETERGRWFLAEYARRNRAADTDSILAALERLGDLPSAQAGGIDPTRLRELAEMISSIRSAPWQGAVDRQGRPAHIRPAQTSESAVSGVRRAAEKIREVAFELREAGGDEIYANALELYCTDLDSASRLQEAATRQLSEIASLLPTVEEALAAIAGGDPFPEPPDPQPPTPGPEGTDAPSIAGDGAPLAETQAAMRPADARAEDAAPPVLMLVNPR